MRKFIPYFLFFILSLTPFLWYPSASAAQFIGAGDYLSPAGLNQEMENLFFVYNRLQYGGFDSSLELGAFIPFWIIILAADAISLSPVAGTFLYIAFSIFLAMFSMYLWLNHNLRRYRFAGIVAGAGAVLYAYTPYLSVYIFPGHMANYSILTLYPLIFLLSEKILMPPRISSRHLIIYFLITAFATNGASWGIGPIYILFWATALYALVMFVVYRFPWKRHLVRTVLLLLTILLSNSYWLVPWSFSGLSQTTTLGTSSIHNRVDLSSRFSSVAGLLLARSDGMILYLYRTVFPYTAAFWILVAGLYAGMYLNRRSRRFMAHAGALLLALFITKGTNPPFAGIFWFLFRQFPGFTTFRRPVNKFAGVYLVFFITAGLLGLLTLLSRLAESKKPLVVGILTIFCLSSAVLIFPLASIRGLLTPFSVPEYYREAWTTLGKEEVSRVLILPGLYGVQPTFNNSMNRYHGYDFIHKIWATSVITPDESDYSPDYPIKKPTNQLTAGIISGQDVCRLTRETAVSHIVVREDLDRTNQFEMTSGEYLKKLRESDIWSRQKYFGPETAGLAVFSVRPECRSQRISVFSDNAQLSYRTKAVANTKIVISLDAIPQEKLEILLLDNYSPWWRLIPEDLSGSNWLQDLALFLRPNLISQSHDKTYGWANGWEFPAGTSRVLTLYYLPQSAVYLGFIIWVCIILTGIGFAYVRKRKFR